MYAWPAPELPVLPGRGVPLRVYDSSVRDVVTITPGPVARLYVCGITPYDATHMGHAATYVAFDLLQRVWRDAGHEVEYVQNVTDVDDPLLERAERDGIDWAELARRETTLFREDMASLRVLPPANYIGVVEAIPMIVPLVEDLLAKGAAYPVEGDIYFSVASDERFGGVSGYSAAEMLEIFGERGGDPERAGKKNALDPLLWRAQRPDEPSWEAPFGAGRPGWHIECVAIALKYLGMGFDVQGGGSDLVFPHHEMGASHAHVHTGEKPYAKAYVHAGMVALDGEKMSKSRGNLIFVSKLRHEGVDPMAIRLVLLANHYRSDWEWTEQALADARERLALWRAAVGRPDGPDTAELLARIRERMADDLDAPGALVAMDEWARRQLADGGDDMSAPGVASRALDAILGIAL